MSFRDSPFAGVMARPKNPDHPSAGAAVAKDSAGRWIDARGKLAKAPPKKVMPISVTVENIEALVATLSGESK